jgi:hypothetical protein
MQFFLTLKQIKSISEILRHVVNRRFGGKYRLHLQGRRISQARNHCEGGSKRNLKMEVTFSSETSVDFERTTQRYILENRTAHKHHCEKQAICIYYHHCVLRIGFSADLS